MGEKKVFFDGELGKVCGILSETKDKNEIVIIIHGFTTHKNTSAKIMAEDLCELGISSLRIDLDSFGESELDYYNASVSNYIKQVEASVKYVEKIGFKNVSLIGSSFGGVVAIGYAMKYNNLNRMLLRYPGAGAYYKFLIKGKEKEYENIKKKSYVAPIEEIANKDYNLNVPLYVEKYDLAEIDSDINKVKSNWESVSQSVKEISKKMFDEINEVLK
ncbi:MAG: alpha/beta hydrolase [Nanoarchaeota archaeon]|nr:alpha/beta hydrolase [Nanoarchaeota archaeon]